MNRPCALPGFAQIGLFSRLTRRPVPPEDLVIGGENVPVRFIHNRLARRCILRVRPDGSVRVTIPRGGSIKEAIKFTQRNVTWIEQQLRKLQDHPVHPRVWSHATEIMFRGNQVALSISPADNGIIIRFADQSIPLPATPRDLRPAVEEYMWRLAAQELPPLTLALAAQHQLAVKRVTIRRQRSRWGSCSPRGTISLNWKLVQIPDFVRDYIILHELMHLHQMNHSPQFWKLVTRACPQTAASKRWLRCHAALLR